METTTRTADRLISDLEEELCLVEDLIRFAGEKESLLIASDAEGLNAVLQEEEETVCALREKETVRKRSALALGESLGIWGSDLPLNKLADRMEDQPARQKLLTAGSALKLAMKKLSRRTDKVKALLKLRAGYADFMVRLFYQAQNQSHFYNMQGNREEKVSQVSRLDFHA